MLDFISIKAKANNNGLINIYPEFLVKKSKDLMIRGRSFYAVWDEESGMWSRSEDDVQRLVDQETKIFAETKYKDCDKSLKLLGNFSSKKWTEFQQYCKSLPDNYHELDDHVVFSNSNVKKTDYISKKLPYPIEQGPCPSYDEMMQTLYSEEERQKLEWAIGSIISGDSKDIQKFIVLYGGPRTGKSTVINIVEELFPGYYSVFDSRALGSANNVFALEAFRSNPLIAIQHDGDLSHIEDNTKLNSIVSHETIMVNEKFKSTYQSKFNSFIFMGTNKPVRITDAKSGIIRRLIDVSPTGNLIPKDRYDELKYKIKFELSAIAYHCLQVYKDLGANYYDGYLPVSMMEATNDFYNFIEDNYDFWTIDYPDGVTLNVAWLKYKDYCSEANVPFPYNKRMFKEELKNYFRYFDERIKGERNVYREFLKEKLEYKPLEKKKLKEQKGWLEFNSEESIIDIQFSDCPAQYANGKEIPSKKWSDISTKLKDLDTKKLHYLKVPNNLIVIDFDIKNENGEKDYDLNLEAANKWPATYAELSKSGKGIHLHYIYEGDTQKLSRIFSENIEVKVFNGNSSLRRMLTKCNDIPIATISSGLILKEDKKMIKNEQIKSERKLRELIKRSLRKEIMGYTKPEIDFICHILDEVYESGLKYDVTDLRPAIQAFAVSSSNNAEYCLKAINKMRFKSDDPSDNIDIYKKDQPIVFFDVEVFPNLFIVVFKKQGKDNLPTALINPTPQQIEELISFKLVGFNNRRYDNHILYARLMGYTEKQLFELSQKIIDNFYGSTFNEAYNLSYTDVYDFLSAQNKMSLKKWEIKLGIHHQELGLPWNEEVKPELWETVADYCKNDVVATEAVWDNNQADWMAREILADLSGLTVNDTTNQHTTKIIVGNDKHPQSQFVYTDLSTIFPGYRYDKFGIPKEEYKEGAKIVAGKSIYKGVDPGEGGRVFANPGMYFDVALLDIASMHPHSAIKLNVFGDVYTKRFKDLVQARIYIKHKDFDKVKTMLDGKLTKYLEDPSLASKLSTALKTAINSVYGLTSASFSNLLRDPRNIDNIVAKYGALFMINLQEEVEKRGFTVVHIKTDSIKIANANMDIINFVSEYGKQYGYSFEHEATYKKMCLVNESVYVANYEDPDICFKKYGYIPEKNQKSGNTWTATGTQFQIPYVFKTLFSKEPIQFEDLCETKSVNTALYLDMNQDLGENEHNYHFVGKVGSFCPILPGHNGGILLREKDGKFSAVAGTKKKEKVQKGEIDIYYWLESEVVKNLGLEEFIDKRYYNALVDEAVDTISNYGDFESFISDD